MSSLQSRVFIITHITILVLDFIGETYLYDVIPTESASIPKMRFWSQYLISLIISLIIGEIGYKSIDCLVNTGHNNLAWAAALIPTAAFTVPKFILHGMDTIFYNSSGVSSVYLVKGALKKRTCKKNCVNK
jgi:hydrogenase-4 membrane subunit HyfE